MAYQLEKDINSWYAICIWSYELMIANQNNNKLVGSDRNSDAQPWSST